MRPVIVGANPERNVVTTSGWIYCFMTILRRRNANYAGQMGQKAFSGRPHFRTEVDVSGQRSRCDTERCEKKSRWRKFYFIGNWDRWIKVLPRYLGFDVISVVRQKITRLWLPNSSLFFCRLHEVLRRCFSSPHTV